MTCCQKTDHTLPFSQHCWGRGLFCVLGRKTLIYRRATHLRPSPALLLYLFYFDTRTSTTAARVSIVAPIGLSFRFVMWKFYQQLLALAGLPRNVHKKSLPAIGWEGLFLCFRESVSNDCRKLPWRHRHFQRYSNPRAQD